MTCTCPVLHLNVGPRGDGFIRNWSAKCPQHGVDSEWYKSPEQVMKRTMQSAQLRMLQERAAEARRQARA